jgi:hypothetical protein
VYESLPDLDRSLALDIDEKVTDLTQDFTAAEQHRLLTKLSCAHGAAFNSHLHEHEPLCLHDTRVDLLHQLQAWSQNPSDKCIFWLNGMAGTGKSTIARTIAGTFAKEKRLGASFFFSMGGGDRSHAGMFFSTLAVQLANMSPTLKRHICQAIAEDPGISQQALRDQWGKLILRPLSMSDGNPPRPSTLVLVIDALDECEHQDDIRVILGLLAKAKDLNVVRLRIFITSRPETPIRLGFRAIPGAVHQDFVLHDISQSVIEHDISLFTRHELGKIKKDHGAPADWPSERNIKLLIQRADCLFIYAATVCRFIGDPKWLPEERLSVVLQGDAAVQSPIRKLDEMYTQVLKHSVIGNSDEQEKIELCERFRQIVGSIVILFDSLSSTALTRLLSIPAKRTDQILSLLHSILDVPENQDSPIRVLHPSFRDFLLDEQRCLDDQFRINEKRTHNDIVKKCLWLMSRALKMDICDLQMPGVLTSEVGSSKVASCLPVHVQYACRYWVDHLQRGEVGLCDDNGQAHKFLLHHFLHWLEALSLMGKMSEGVLMMKDLQSMVNVGVPM